MEPDRSFDFSQIDPQYLIDTLPLSVALLTPEGRLGYISPAYRELFHMPEGYSAVGTHVLDWISEDDAETLNRRWGEKPPPGVALEPTVFPLRRYDGEKFLCEICSRSIFDRDGQFLGLVALLRDVTGARRLEDGRKANLERQDFFNNLLQLLYRPRDLMAAVEQVLGMIGIYTGASRVTLMENAPDEASACVTLEWLEHDPPNPGPNPPPDKFVCVDYLEAPSLRQIAEGRGVVTAPGEFAAPDLADLLARWGLQSLAALPVFGAERLFGLVMIEFAAAPRRWDPEDLDLMRNISHTVSNAVARKQAEDTEVAHRVLVETLRDITSVVNSDFTFSQVLEYILSNLNRIVPHATSSILLVDDQGYLRVAHTHGFTEQQDALLRAMQNPLNRWKTINRVMRSASPVIVADTLREPAWEHVAEFDWVRAYMGAAIRSRGTLLGVINVDSTTVDAFTAEHAARLQAFANQAAVAIENAVLYQEAHRRADQMTTLYQLGLTLASGLDLEQVLAALHDQVRRVLPFDLFYVALHDSKTGQLTFPLFFERGQRLKIPARNVRQQPGLTGLVIDSRQTLYFHDVWNVDTLSAQPVYAGSSGETRAFVGVPLIAREQVVGVMSMQAYDPGAFSLEQVRLLETIANQAALALDNARIFDAMTVLAITDSLTGLYNRRHFTTLGQTELERAVRYGRGLGVLMVDIDLFKNVNDTLGHQAGDAVLQAVSRLCRAQLRSSDIIGRYGGEEFAILLPESSEARALSVAERIRMVIEDAEIDTPKGPVRVTISQGLAWLNNQPATLETLLDCADRALYQAKQAGRNRVHVCEHAAPPAAER